MRVGSTVKPWLDPNSGKEYSTAVAYGDMLQRTQSSVISTVFIQAQDLMENFADNNDDTFLLRIYSDETEMFNGTLRAVVNESFMSVPFSRSIGTKNWIRDRQSSQIDLVPEEAIGLHFERGDQRVKN